MRCFNASFCFSNIDNSPTDPVDYLDVSSEEARWKSDVDSRGGFIKADDISEEFAPLPFCRGVIGR